MKKNLLLLVFISFGFALRAQTYGNEWIDYSQMHYKVKVAADGIYRINASTLAAYLSLGSLNTSSFAMYHNGQAVPLYISSSSTLGPNDYIEFYGVKNIGDVDSFLYRNDSMQTHPYYSLFNDTSTYYLTIRTSGVNPRYSEALNNLSSLPPKETYFTHISRQVYTIGYIAGKYYLVGNDQVFKSTFDYGEGYTNNSFFGNFSAGSQTANQNFTIATPGFYTGGPQAVFRGVYMNYSPSENHTVKIQLNSNTLLPFETHYGFHLNRVSAPINQLNNGNNTVIFSANDNAVSSQQNLVCLNEIEYPHTFDFNNQNTFHFYLDADPVNRKYMEITNFNSAGSTPVLYDITNRLIIRSSQSPGSTPLKFVLPPSSAKRELYLISGDVSTINTVSKVNPILFENYSASNLSAQGDYLIISHKSLFSDADGNGYDEITDYKRYRDMDDNPGTGKYHARIFDIEQLYDQFAYGVGKSPLAIRNLIQYGKDKWTIKPEYVFLIGKAREYIFMRTNATAYAQCVVPTFGFPGSDNLLAATRGSDIPVVGIGRLAARTAQQVKDYREKMKQYDAAQNVAAYAPDQVIEPKLWQKQVLHFSGGTTFSEQTLFRYYVDSYKNIVRDTSWGANVHTFSRTSNAPIEQAQAQVIRDKINTGVSLITFFGHSATGAFDFSIDEPENYTNAGKYPVIISNGCFAGFIHDINPGFSERFVLQPNKGAIAFMATSSLSVASGLNVFSSNVYNNLSKKNYFKTFGECVKQALADIYTCCSGDDFAMMTAYEMTLHGDPGLTLNQYPKPDYAIETPSVYFTPSTVTAGLDSFEVSVVITNLGKAVKDSMAVTLTRTIFDQQGAALPPYIYRKTAPCPYYIDTVTFKIPTQISTLGYGTNLFSPYVDADFRIDEMAENNNGLSTPISINIQSDDIIPIYPYEYAIDSDQVITLKASTINPFVKPRAYAFEIDTTEFFTSPLKQSGTVFQGGGVLHWTPSLTYQDSVVYYWRVKIDTGTRWHNSSFVYIRDQYGWNQSHVFQLLKDNYLNVKLDTTSRVFSFPNTVNNIHVLTGWSNATGGNVDYNTLGWDYNNNNMYRFRMGGCYYQTGFLSGITFAVINNVTGLPLTSRNSILDHFGDGTGNAHCADKATLQYGFDFATNGTHPDMNASDLSSSDISNKPWSQVIKRFINNIPDGYYVLIYSTNTPDYYSWDTTLVSALQSLGMQAQLFKNGQINGPFVFFTQKGNISFSPVFDYKNGYSSALQKSINFNGAWNQGQYTSPAIGPSHGWDQMQWRKHAMETPTADKDTVDVIGIGSNGSETVLLSTTQYDNSLHNINAQQYPYLKLRMRTYDDSLRTPTQLDYWRILYQKVPEAAINPSAHFVYTDSFNLGGNFNFEIGLENVSNIPMDSILVKYTIRDAALSNYNYSIRHSPLPGLDTMILKFNLPVSSNSYQGLNKLTVEANPAYDQPEQYHFNNFAEIDFHTIGDKTNPLVDVTFDGQHIFNGDIVSAKPDILITLKDENKFLALNDTSMMNVYLKYPGETTPQRVSFDNVIMKFYPADSTNLSHSNKAQIELKPTLVLDGTYELMIKDQDRSGNHSSSQNRYEGNTFYDYKTSFEVVNKPMITNVLNYPNPFTTSTKFVFTITGTEIPDILKIQILTIKGTVVKEISKDELGPLHIGRNITEYAWNGRDQYGDLLANGVYFYRVATRLDSKKMDQMSMSYDKYFKKGFGKMVIIR